MTIKPIGLFYTPNDWDDLMEWIDGHVPEERSHILVGACMSWNLACRIVNETQQED